MKKLLTMLLVATVITISLAPDTSDAKTYNLKMHTFVPEPVIIVSGFMTPFIKKVQERSNGQIKITPYYVMALVPPLELTAATSAGSIDIALNSPGYDRGIVPQSLSASNLPFGFGTPEQAEHFWKEYEGGKATQIMQAAYRKKNVFWISYVNSVDPITFLTADSIMSAADISGMKIRSSGAYAHFLKNMGAAHVNLGMGEVYTAIEKRVIDGTFAATTMLDDFKLNEVVKYYMEPAPQFGGSLNLQINLDVFNDMSSELQKIIVDTTHEVNETILLPMTMAATKKALDNAAAVGVKTTTVGAADIAQMKAAFEDEWVSAEKGAPEIMKLMKAYLNSQGISYPGK